MTAAKEGDCRIVIDRFGVHAADDAEFIGDLCRVWKEIAELNARAAVTRKPRETACKRQHRLIAAHARQALTSAHAVGKRLTLHVAQARFRIKRFELRWST